MLTLYIDFKSPAAYLALAPTVDLIERRGLSVTWKAFNTVQKAVPEQTENETVGESHRRVRAQARRDTHLGYAARQGLDMRFQDPPGSTDLALATLTQLTTDPLPFIKSAFHAYWVEGADLNLHDTVSALLGDNGYAPACMPTDVEAVVAAAQAEGEAAGVVDAPAYLIAEQLFIGREHLPWIESLISQARASLS